MNAPTSRIRNRALLHLKCLQEPGRVFWLVLLSSALVCGVFADELNTVAGERFLGKAISVSDDYLVFVSQTAGKVMVARSNVLSLMLGSNAVPSRVRTNQPPPGASGQDKAMADVVSSLPNLPEADKSLSRDLVAQAGPEATARFNQILRGLLTGTMSVSDLRAEARSVRDQARALRAELDDETGAVLDGYLAILDRFLAESPSAQKPVKGPAR